MECPIVYYFHFFPQVNTYRVNEEDLEILRLDSQFGTPGYLTLEHHIERIDVV